MSFTTGLMIALIGVLIAGLASVIAIWMERDAARPKHWALSLSALILLTTVVSMYQSYDDAQQSEKMEEDLARMLGTLDKIASESDVEIPGLNNLLSKELEAQSRSNPGVVSKLSERVAADGGDPQAMLSRHMPASEVNALGNNVSGKNAKAGGSGSNAADKARIAKLEKQLASMQSASKKGSDAESKLKTEVESLKANAAKLQEEQAAQKEAMDKLKAENEALKEKLKNTAKKNARNSLWSNKG